jgi:transcriptional regulator with XRE-family HTH domain
MHLIPGGCGLLHVPLYKVTKRHSRPGTLPDFFRKMRLYRGLSRGSLSQKFGISEKYISDIETGARFPSLRYCLLCAGEFGANPGWVKSKYANEAIYRYSSRIKKRLGVDD